MKHDRSRLALERLCQPSVAEARESHGKPEAMTTGSLRYSGAAMKLGERQAGNGTPGQQAGREQLPLVPTTRPSDARVQANKDVTQIA